MKLVNVLVFPIVLYGAETWTMLKQLHERRKIDTSSCGVGEEY